MVQVAYGDPFGDPVGLGPISSRTFRSSLSITVPVTGAERAADIFYREYVQGNPRRDKKTVSFGSRVFSPAEFYREHLCGIDGPTQLGREYIELFETYEPLLEEKGFH
jgi:hypothetical protein